MEERIIVPLKKEGGGGGGGGGCDVLCILMGFRFKNEPNDLYGHPNDLGILLIPKWSNP